MHTILITGSNRGLGLEWARQYAAEGWRVIATCRHPAEALALQELADHNANVSLHKLDVTSAPQVAALAQLLQGEPVDLLLNNAGVYFEKFVSDQLGEIHYGDWEESYRVNVLGSVRMVEALRVNLARSAKRLVVAITSHMGSVAEITHPGSYAYRSSKAALNATMKGLSHELRADHIGVLLLHPGWVQTRMGGPGAPLTVTQSVDGMRRLVERFEMRQSGSFLRYDGSVIPW